MCPSVERSGYDGSEGASPLELRAINTLHAALGKVAALR
jgi:hypothetical protein